MRCAGCGHDNRSERRFCAGCGAGLSLACTRCGFANLPGERFCGGCGAAMESVAPTGERRQVAILFADLAGYTRLSTTLDPEEVHRLLTGFFEVVDGACARFGGTIDKHIGDNVMAIFGAPIAHGDDPERAVRAAVAIHEEVAAYSTRVRRELKVHVGIAYGEVVASGLGSAHHQEYTVTGDAVNLAARLQDKAVGGQTMISDAVKRAAERIAVCEPVGDVEVKGLPAPVSVWRLVGVRAAVASVRLVGRERELATISAQLDAGRGALVVVRGEAGIGKSTLIAAAARFAVGRGIAVHHGQVLDFGQGRGAGAIPSLVASLLGAPAGANDEQRRAALETARRADAISAADALSLASLLELDAASGDDDETERRARQRAALAALVASRPGRCAVFVEDVHWADTTTLARLRALTAAVVEKESVVVVTTRIDGDPLDDAWRAAARIVLELDLDPLDDTDALRLAAEHLVDHDLITRCVERAGGNPLFLEQLVHAATRDAVLPGTLQGLVLARVDRLPPRDRGAIAAAAVSGQRIDLDLVRALTGDAAWIPDELVARRLVVRRGEAFAFHHALILDGVYASLTHARRKELHRSAAAFYDGRDLALRAEHLERAGEADAAVAWRAAAEQHVTAHHPDRALALLERGLACAVSPRDQHALHALAGTLHNELGDGNEAARSWRAALDTASDDLARGLALIGLGGAHRFTARYAEGIEHLGEAERLLSPLERFVELAEIYYLRGSMAFAMVDIEQCRSAHLKALEHARRAGAREWEARALSGLGDALYLQAAFPEALDAFQSCADLSDDLGMHRYALLNRVMVADSMIFLMKAREADEMLLQLADQAAAMRAGRAEALALESVVFSRAVNGQFDAAHEILSHATARCRDLGMRMFELFLRNSEAEIRFLRGDVAGARELVEETSPTVDALGSSLVRCAFDGLRCFVSDADERVRILAAYDGPCSVPLVAIQFRATAIEACLREKDWPHALRQAELLEREAPGVPFTRLVVDRARAMTAWGRGDRSPQLAAELRRLRQLASDAGYGRLISDPDGIEAN